MRLKIPETDKREEIYPFHGPSPTSSVLPLRGQNREEAFFKNHRSAVKDKQFLTEAQLTCAMAVANKLAAQSQAKKHGLVRSLGDVNIRLGWQDHS